MFDTLDLAITTETVNSTPEAPLVIGFNRARRTVTARHTFRLDVSSAPLPLHYIHQGDLFIPECGRCAGSGNYGSGPYNGICFLCNGSGVHGTALNHTELEDRLNRWAKRGIAESRAAARRIDARTAERNAWIAANAELVAWAKALAPSFVEEGVDSYIAEGTTEDAAKANAQGRFQERMLWVHPYPDGKWGACFVYDEERFTQFGDRADNMIRRVRADADLDRRETGYLKAVMTSDTARQADPRVAASRHAAEPGTRLTITGKVTASRDWHNEDGEVSTRFVTVEGTGTDSGITWKTWSSAATAWGREEGEIVRVKATVKRNGEYKGIKEDVVQRPVFTVLDEEPASAPQETPATPAPDPAPKTPAKAASASVTTPPPAAKGKRREALGASSVDGWELLYDKPRAGAEVVRQGDRYALVCKAHKTLHHLDRLTDEGKVRKAGGWCTEGH